MSDLCIWSTERTPNHTLCNAPASKAQNEYHAITLLGQGPLHVERSWEHPPKHTRTNNVCLPFNVDDFATL